MAPRKLLIRDPVLVELGPFISEKGRSRRANPAGTDFNSEAAQTIRFRKCEAILRPGATLPRPSEASRSTC